MINGKGEGMIDRGELLRKAALNVIHLSGLPYLARSVFSGVGAILMLHRVSDDQGTKYGFNKHLTVTPAYLDETLSTIGDLGYEIVSIDEAIARLSGKPGNGKPFVAITLDDGYRDNLTEALPVFEKHNAPFAIYIAPGLIDGTTTLWWDTIEEVVTRNDQVCLPGDNEGILLDSSTPRKKIYANCVVTEHLTHNVEEELLSDAIRIFALNHGVDADEHRLNVLMNWDEIIEISKHPLCTIGAHSLNHLNLRRLDTEGAEREIVAGRSVLEERLGKSIAHMAYPYGYVAAAGKREVEITKKAGFASALTTRHGVLQAEHADYLHVLPRISVNGRYQNQRYIRAMLSGVTGVIANGGRRVTTY